LSRPQFTRWKEIIELSKKTFGVNGDSLAAVAMAEDWLEMKGRVDV
jgi:hypothetical protein